MLCSLLRITVWPEVVEVFPVTNRPLLTEGVHRVHHTVVGTTQWMLWSLLRVTVRPEDVEVFPVTNTPLHTEGVH